MHHIREQIMKAKIRYVLLLVSLLATLPALAEEGVADARRHMVRGIAAIEMAKSATDLAPAAVEFRRATELDPTLSAAWYNLGSVQVKLGQFDEAIQSYKRYLALSPQADDAQKIQDEIIKLEYKQEKVNIVANFSATWTAGQNTYVISVNKLEFNLKATEQINSSASGIKLISDGGFLLGKRDSIPHASAEVIFKGRIDGSSIKGTRTRAAFMEEVSDCTVPVDQGEFTGTVSEDGKQLTLNFQVSQFQLDRDIGPFFGMDSCTGVTKTGELPGTLVFKRPEPQGNASPDSQLPKDVGLVGLQLTNTDPQLIADVVPNLPAADAGIRAGDRIRQVDGKDVKDLKIAQLVELLRGQAGTKVTVEVERQGEANPLSFTLVRKAQ
jgi:hypothetical protein